MLKIVAYCIFACSLSYNGNTSNPEVEESLPPLPSPVPSLDLDSAHDSSDQASSASVPTDTNIIAEEPTDISLPTTPKKRGVLRRKSTTSKPKGREVEKKTEEGKPVANLSDKMQVELPSPDASKFAAFAHYLLPEIKKAKSKTFFAPEELLPVHILLALLADEIKVSDKTHSIVYIPSEKIFIGFMGMLYGKESTLKSSLLFEEFKGMKNVINSLSLLCISTKQDLKKISNKKDMETGEELIRETTKQQWYEARTRVKRTDAEKRPEESTLARFRAQEIQNTESNLATYKLIVPQPKIDDPLPKSKKKSPSKETQQAQEIHFLLSVTKIIEEEKDASSTSKASTSHSNKSGSTTPRKRAKSKGANANAASSSASSLSQVEEDSKNLENKLESGEEPTEPSAQSLEKGQ